MKPYTVWVLFANRAKNNGPNIIVTVNAEDEADLRAKVTRSGNMLRIEGADKQGRNPVLINLETDPVKIVRSSNPSDSLTRKVFEVQF